MENCEGNKTSESFESSSTYFINDFNEDNCPMKIKGVIFGKINFQTHLKT